MKTIYQISDCHLIDDLSFTRFTQALDLAAADESCDTVIFSGDLCCQPSISDYENVATLIESKLPNKALYAMAGNHDCITSMKKAFRHRRIKALSKAKLHGRQFLFLDSSQKPIAGHHPLGSGRITRRDLALVKKSLRSKREPIIMVHHPIIRVGSDWMKAICLENDEQLLAMLNRSRRKHQNTPIEVICGHGHAAITSTFGKVIQYMAPATAYGFDHTLPEYNRSDDIGISRFYFQDGKLTYETMTIDAR